MKNNGQKRPKNGKFILYLILGGFIIKGLAFLFNKDKIRQIKDNFTKFLEEEEKEIDEVKTGKESIKRYCRDSANIFCEYFIPNNKNNHKPKLLRTKSLTVIVVLLAIIKVSITGYLYFVYPNTGKMQSQITKEILLLINKDRQAAQLPPVSLNTALSASAQAKADDMVINNYFAHYSPTGKKPWDWIDRNSYPYLFVGENLAMNFTSADSAHNALMNSPSHKKNIMNEKYSDIGLAVVSGEINGKQTNVLVELFGYKATPTTVLAKTETQEDQLASSQEIAKESNSTEVLGTTKKEEVKEVPIPANSEADAPSLEPEQPIQEVQIIDQTKLAKGTAITEEEARVQPQPVLESEPEVEAINTKITEVSPEEELIANEQELRQNINNQVVFFAASTDDNTNLARNLIKYSRYIYIGILAVLVLALAFNILIKITVQHKPVIIQTLLVIIFIIGLLTVRTHILENLLNQIIII